MNTISISDYAHLVLKLNIPNVRIARTDWHFNTILLEGEDFAKFISEKIPVFLEVNTTADVSLSAVWEMPKAHLREQIISFTVNKKKEDWKQNKQKLVN